MKSYRLVLVEGHDEYITDYPEFAAAMRAFKTTVVQQTVIKAELFRVVDGKVERRVAYCDNTEAC